VFQKEISRKRIHDHARYGRHGLGLAISKQLVVVGTEGDWKAESRPGHGVHVHVRLPTAGSAIRTPPAAPTVCVGCVRAIVGRQRSSTVAWARPGQRVGHDSV